MMNLRFFRAKRRPAAVPSGEDSQQKIYREGTTSDTQRSPESPRSHDLQVEPKPSKIRVRVLIEIVDNPAELATASTAFSSKGWTICPLTTKEATQDPSDGRTWLLIEVRLQGSPGSAIKTAVKRTEQVIEDFNLGAAIRRAELVRFSQEARYAYLIKEAPPHWLTGHPVLAKVFVNLAGTRTTGMISVEAPLPESMVLQKLQGVNLGYQFDPNRSFIRPAVVARSPEGGVVAASFAPPVRGFAAAISLILVLICGYSFAYVSGPWKAVPAVMGMMAFVLVVRGLPNYSISLRICAAVALTVPLSVVGFEFSLHGPVAGPSRASIFVAVTIICLIVWRGLVLALRDSWFTRQITWIASLAVTVIAPLSLWFGGIYDAEYLERFKISSSSVPIPTIFRLEIASKSFALGFALVLCCIALIGFIRYYHWAEDVARWVTWLTIALLALIYFLASVSVGLHIVDAASANAAIRAAAGRQPGSYFGIEGNLMCIKPVSASFPVYDGPLPMNRPVLSFGTDGGELWVWDPASDRSIGLPLSDVIVTPSAGSPASC